MDFLSMFLQPLVMLAAPSAVALVKKFGPKIPKLLLPVVSSVIGAGIGYVTDLGSVHGGLLGLAGVGVREILDQVKQALPAA